MRVAEEFLRATLLGAVGLFALAGYGLQSGHPESKSLKASGTGLNYNFRSWQQQNGLPEETVQAFAQTPDGYLWIGTTGGLLRFDGAQFQQFSHVNTPAFAEDDVFCLLAGHDGRLWIGTSGGGLIEWQNGTFHAYEAEIGQSSAYVRALAEDHNGLVWVATDGGLFWARNGRLERTDKSVGWSVPDAHAILEDRSGRIWAGGSHLFSLTLKDGRFNEYRLPGNDNRNQVKSLAETADGIIWVGTVSGLYRLRPGSDRLEPVPSIAGLIRTLRAVPGGELWAGTIGAGIFRIHGGRITRMRAPASLISNTVYSIFIDSDHDLWLGTLTGVMCLSQTPVRNLALPEAAGSDFGTVAVDSDGSLWAASNQLVHIRGDRVEPVRFPELGEVRVRNLLRSRDGSLWIGTIGGGVYQLANRAARHFTMQEGLSSNFVQVLLEARDGTMWIGTNNGVSHLDRSGLHNLRTLNGLAANYIRSLMEARDGTIWVGTDRGLYGYRNGQYLHDSLATSLGDAKVWALYQDANGGMWIGTHGGGLYHFNHGQLSRFTTANGLASDSVNCILGDNQGHLWVSTPPGVMLLNRVDSDAQEKDPIQPFAPRFYDASEGNPSVQILGGMQPACALTTAGEAWFPTSQGLWSIRPDELEHGLISNLHIDSVTVDGRTASRAGALNLSADSDRVEITYEPVLLRSQDELRFRYRLDHYEEKWTYTSTQQRVASYTNLPAGKFTFLVEAWESDHPEHLVRASIVIYKKRHFYQSLWFVVLCALLLALLSISIYQMRIRQIHGRFKAVLAERTRLAREMHDTLIQGCIAVSALLKAASSTDVDDNESQSHLIDYAATQIHATVDEARQAVWNLRGEKSGTIDLQVALQRLSERIGQEHGVKMTSRKSGRPFPINPQAAHEIMMVARESVFNAILHGGSPRVDVDLTYHDDSLSLTVKDTGQGFDASDAFTEGHFGLRGMQERIHRLGGKFAIESAPGRGTCIRVELSRSVITA